VDLKDQLRKDNLFVFQLVHLPRKQETFLWHAMPGGEEKGQRNTGHPKILVGGTHRGDK